MLTIFRTGRQNSHPRCVGRRQEQDRVLNEQAKKQLLQSSVMLGDDKTDYSSTAQRAQMENPASALVEPYNRDHHIQYD